MFAAALIALAPFGVAAQERAADAPAAHHETGLELGEISPDFTLDSLAGETYRLSDLRGERPILLLFFRGTW